MVAVLWFLELARAGCLTPAFAGENRLYLAHGRQRSLEGSWRGKALTGGHDGDLRERCARGLQMGLPDCCVRGKGAPLPLRPLRPQARRGQNPKDQCNPKKVNFSPRLVRNLLQPTTAPANWPRFHPDRHFRPLQVSASLFSFSAPASPGSRGRSAAVKSSLPPNRQLSKLSARPAAPPGRPARSFRTNIPTHTSMRAPPHGPEPPNQT